MKKFLVFLLMLLLIPSAFAEESAADVAYFDIETLFDIRTASPEEKKTFVVWGDEMVSKYAVIRSNIIFSAHIDHSYNDLFAEYEESLPASNIRPGLFTENQSLFIYELLKSKYDPVDIIEPGTYRVGWDIEPGAYRFMYGDSWLTNIRIGDAFDKFEEDIDYEKTTINYDFSLWNPLYSSYNFQLTEVYIALQEGFYIVVESGNVRVEPVESELRW